MLEAGLEMEGLGVIDRSADTLLGQVGFEGVAFAMPDAEGELVKRVGVVAGEGQKQRGIMIRFFKRILARAGSDRKRSQARSLQALEVG
jgi:hypothetical protein